MVRSQGSNLQPVKRNSEALLILPPHHPSGSVTMRYSQLTDLVYFWLLVREQGGEVEKSAAVENHLRLVVGARHNVTESTQGGSLINEQHTSVDGRWISST